LVCRLRLDFSDYFQHSLAEIFQVWSL